MTYSSTEWYGQSPLAQTTSHPASPAMLIHLRMVEAWKASIMRAVNEHVIKPLLLQHFPSKEAFLPVRHGAPRTEGPVYQAKLARRAHRKKVKAAKKRQRSK